jgi:uncharacterized membrane protein HdeD (DUF308 family)
LVVAAVASLLFGILMLASPRHGVVAVMALIAAYAFVVGIMFISLGVRLRGLSQFAPRAV